MSVKGFDTLSAKCAVILLCAIVLITLFAPFITRHDPVEVNLAERLSEPSKEHILGTDQMGRDLLARVIYGGRGAVSLAVSAGSISMLIGMIIGLFAGYYGGHIDTVLLYVTNIIQGLPSLAIMLALAAILGPGIKSILIALVVTSWTGFSRIVRGEILRLREEDFVEGIRTLGVRHSYIMVRHLIPNIAGKNSCGFYRKGERRNPYRFIPEFSWFRSPAACPRLGYYGPRRSELFPVRTAVNHCPRSCRSVNLPQRQCHRRRA